MKRISIRRLSTLVMYLCKFVILAATAGAFLYLVLGYYPETDFHFKGFIIFEFIYLVIFLAFANTYNCFRIGVIRYREIIFTYFLATFMTNFLIYFVLSLTAKALLGIWPLLIMMLIQWVTGALLYRGAEKLYYVVHPAREAILVYSGDGHERGIIKKFDAIRARYVICAECCESEGVETIENLIGPFSTVILGDVDRALKSAITEHCFERNKRLFFMPGVQDIIMRNAQETFIGDSLLYLCKNRTFSLEQLAVKRLIDITLSVVGLVLASPIMLLTAAGIKAYDGGPAVFKQVRYTRNMTPFTMYKFRSMIVDAEKDGARFTTQHDDRITPIGKFIRRVRIDELPQLFNVLKGEMSIVGPRAERIENADFYLEILPEFRYRTKVKAGLTGYAQIYGKYNTSYEDKLKLDLLYIENCSLVRDLQLMFLTVKVLFLPSSTEGYEMKTLEEIDTTPRR